MRWQQQRAHPAPTAASCTVLIGQLLARHARPVGRACLAAVSAVLGGSPADVAQRPDPA